MKVKGKISWWYDDDAEDGSPPPTTEVIEGMKQAAIERAAEMIAEGYHSGELFYSHYDEETDTDTEYRGWWESRSKYNDAS